MLQKEPGEPSDEATASAKTHFVKKQRKEDVISETPLPPVSDAIW